MAKRMDDQLLKPPTPEEEPSAPDISVLLMELGQGDARFRTYNGAWVDSVNEKFKSGFLREKPKQQRAVALQLKALELEGTLFDSMDEGIVLIRQQEISNRFLELMEHCSVVASGKEGGVDRAMTELKPLAVTASGYIRECVSYVTEFHSADRLINAERKKFVTIAESVQNMITRLGITDAHAAPKRGERDREKPRNSLHIFHEQLDARIQTESLIGFSTLTKLLDEFRDTMDRFEDAVDERETD